MNTKRLAYFASSVILLSACAIAQNTDAAPVPRIACEPSEHNFGTVDDTIRVEHDFVIRNEGAAPLTIGAVRPACGCTLAKLSTNVLNPGEQAIIHITLSLTGRRGTQSKSITVESNDPVQPRLMLWLKGSVTSELYAEPFQIGFGVVHGTHVVSKDVRIVSRSPGVLITHVVVIDSQCFTVEPKDPSGAWGTEFTVHAVPPPGRGACNGTVVVYTDLPTRPELRIPAYVVFVGEARVIPNELRLRGRPGDRVKGTVLLRPGSASDFRVKKVDPPVADAEVTIQNPAKGSYRIDIGNLPISPELDGKTIRIETDLKEMHEIIVPIRVNLL